MLQAVAASGAVTRGTGATAPEAEVVLVLDAVELGADVTRVIGRAVARAPLAVGEWDAQATEPTTITPVESMRTITAPIRPITCLPEQCR